MTRRSLLPAIRLLSSSIWHLILEIKPYFVNYLRDTTTGLISCAPTRSGLAPEIGILYVINGQLQAVLFFNFFGDPGGAIIISWPGNTLADGFG